jgi:RimJ/RimL family protein N-acetyltransferase
MAVASRSLRATVELMRGGQIDTLVAKVRQRLYSDAHAFGLKRDLQIPFEAPAARVPLTVRRLRDSDVVELLEQGDPDEDAAERAARARMLRAGFPNCHVASTEGDRPCYMQWLLGHEDNERIQRYFGDAFPILEPDTALLEGAYTPAAHRGKGIMPAAMAQIAERARELGARYVVTFVATDNIPSLKGCERAGFQPYTVRTERFRLLRRRVTFEPPTDRHPYPLASRPSA